MSASSADPRLVPATTSVPAVARRRLGGDEMARVKDNRLLAEVERLRADNERLRSTLEDIRWSCSDDYAWVAANLALEAKVDT